jgi:GT2 family glycosyltransferase
MIDNPELIHTCGNDVSLTGITTCRYAGELSDQIAANEDVAAVSGAAFAMHRNLFNHLGGFDSRFWMYLEDTDLSWRARINGYRCVLAARSIVHHHYSFRLSPDKTRRIEQNRYLMLGKNLSGLSVLVFAPQLLLGEMLTWGWAFISGPRFLWAKFLATWWALLHIMVLIESRSEVRSIRRVPDSVVLRTHLAIPPLGNIKTGIVAQVMSILILPVGLATASLGMAITRIDQWNTASYAGHTDDSYDPASEVSH